MGNRIGAGGPFLVPPLLAVALVASDAVPRAPLFVCAPAKRLTLQIEHAPNLAVNASIASPARILALIEPTIWKRAAPAIDLAPNLAVRASVAAGRVVPGMIDPAFTDRPSQPPELWPNLAVRVSPVLFMAGPTFDDAIAKRAWPAFDVYPNLALGGAAPRALSYEQWQPKARKWAAVDLSPNLAAPSQITLRPLPQQDAPTPRRWLQAPDLSPNLAAQVVTGQYQAPTAFDWILPKRPWATPDLSPNLAVRPSLELPTPRPQQDAPTRGKWTQPEVYPNLSVRLTVAATVVTPPLDPPTRKSIVGVDLYPNLAVLAPIALRPQPQQDAPQTRKPWTAVELYPNLAIRFVATVQPRATPVEPWINKRFAPQIDVYPNVSLLSVVPPPVVIIRSIDLDQRHRVEVTVETERGVTISFSSRDGSSSMS